MTLPGICEQQAQELRVSQGPRKATRGHDKDRAVGPLGELSLKALSTQLDLD